MASETTRCRSLTYLSSSPHVLTDEELAEILRVARRNNETLGVTGMLLYADGNFVQTLEGPPDVVGALFERIADDARHRSILVALDEEIVERDYPEWTMGFKALDRDQFASLPGYTDFLQDRKRIESGRGRGRAEVFHRVFRDSLRY